VHLLGSVPIDDLHVVVRFLLHSATGSAVQEMVAQLRRNLSFISVTSTAPSQSDPQSKRGKKEVRTRAGEAMVLDAIQTALQFNKGIASAFYREVKNISAAVRSRLYHFMIYFS
jgi:hypothetical protein